MLERRAFYTVSGSKFWVFSMLAPEVLIRRSRHRSSSCVSTGAMEMDRKIVMPAQKKQNFETRVV